jgi:hypothetical protein
VQSRSAFFVPPTLVEVNDSDASRLPYRADGIDKLLTGPVEQAFPHRRGCGLGVLELALKLAAASDVVRLQFRQRGPASECQAGDEVRRH